MAEAAPNPSMPEGNASAARGAVMPPLARVPAVLKLDPAPPGVSVGLPIIDVPPTVEPLGFDEPIAEIRLPDPARRPVRRRFLPPPPPPAANGHDRRAPDYRDGRHEHQRVPHRDPLPAADYTPDRGERQVGAAKPSSSEAPRQSVWGWRRPLLTGAGVAAALALAVAVEIGANGDWLARLRAAMPQRAAAAPPAAVIGVPRTEQERRIVDYATRAKAGDANAQVALAVLYAKGDGVPQDYATAASWFRRAAEKGIGRAQYDLGVLYERGRGVPLDYNQAVAWYRKAAEQNHPLAQYNLAVAFTKGEGVHRDATEAAVWYHRAASQGVVAAMVNLAILYERGEGVDRSTVDAYAWYRTAAKRGNAAASQRAGELLKAFSLLEQSQAEAKSADIAASIRDAIGDRARIAARSAIATPTGASEPAAKSSLEGDKRAPAAESSGTDNP